MSRRPRVARKARRGDVRGLVSALGYRDVVRDRQGRLADFGIRVRQEAAEALGRVGGEEVVEPLVEALHTDPSPHVRVAAARGLAEAGYQSAVDPLAQVAALFAEPSHVWLRRNAIEALVALDYDSAAPSLLSHLLVRDEPAQLSEADRDGLEGVPGWHPADPHGVLVPQLVAALGHPRVEVQERAADILSWLPGVAYGSVVRALEDETLRPGAALALGVLRDARAVEPLTEVLEDPDPEVRRRAAWSLGELRDPIAVEALIRSTRDDDFAVRAEAGSALDKLGSVAVVLGVAAFMRPMLSNAGMVEARPEQKQLTQGGEDVPAWLRPVLHKLIAGEREPDRTNGDAT